MTKDDVATKAAKWDRIAADWITYCKQGCGGFDWDYDSREVMTELTGERAFQWIVTR